MSLTPDLDVSAAARRARAEQVDPWVCFLLVARRSAHDARDVIAAAAAAVPRLGAACRAEPEWARAWDEWERASVRKVVLRGRPADWERAASIPGVSASVGAECVRALVPVRRSQRAPALRRFQAYSPPFDPRPPDDAAVPPALVCHLRSDVPMSIGKAAAQVAHAAHLARVCPWDDVGHPGWLSAWAVADYPIALQWADDATLDALAATPDVLIIRDAGLTEVAPMTATVAAHPARR